MEKNIIFALLILTFVDSISQNRDYELNDVNQNALSIKIEQERIEIKKQYGNILEVESQIDKGTTFTIVIPVIHSNNKNN